MKFGSKEELLAFKKYIISLLVQQAQSDGHFTLLEKKYLKYAGDQLELSNEEIAEVRADPSAYEIAPPPDEQKRVTILYYSLFMMRADGEINAQEEDMCYRLGLRLGFRAEMVKNLIGVMKTYLKSNLPPDSMLNEIKPYLN